MPERLGDNIKVSSVSGEVLEAIKDNETVVSGTGGGGSVYTLPGGHVTGRISNIFINSTTIKKTIIWIKANNGQEIDLHFDEEIKVRQGHKVTFVLAIDTGINACYVVSLINHTTNNIYHFIDSKSIVTKCSPPLSLSDAKIVFSISDCFSKLLKGFFIGLSIVFCSAAIFGRDFRLYHPLGRLVEAGSFCLAAILVITPITLYAVKVFRIRNNKQSEINAQRAAVAEMFEAACMELENNIKGIISTKTYLETA